MQARLWCQVPAVPVWPRQHGQPRPSCWGIAQPSDVIETSTCRRVPWQQEQGICKLVARKDLPQSDACALTLNPKARLGCLVLLPWTAALDRCIVLLPWTAALQRHHSLNGSSRLSLWLQLITGTWLSRHRRLPKISLATRPGSAAAALAHAVFVASCRDSVIACNSCLYVRADALPWLLRALSSTVSSACVAAPPCPLPLPAPPFTWSAASCESRHAPICTAKPPRVPLAAMRSFDGPTIFSHCTRVALRSHSAEKGRSRTLPE
mmetsp:Transcript_37117/g.109451  ORF Transcript_37117/g.109451 Transcript_37117/m.109451 type:complete len:265 (+) Transcript_37117:142-936(+)